MRGARLARQFWNDPDCADQLEREAAALKQRFNRDFWVTDGEYYALALDPDGGQVDALSSNIGHLLWSGIVEEDKPRRWSSTCSAPACSPGGAYAPWPKAKAQYNPLGYHVGTVWPFDNSIIAWGPRRYGFAPEAARIAEAIIDAARYFDGRLPEAFGGYDRDLTRHPVQYPTANSPEAMATGATFLLLRTLLGLDPHGDDLVLAPRADRTVRPSRTARHPRTVGPGGRQRQLDRRSQLTLCGADTAAGRSYGHDQNREHPARSDGPAHNRRERQPGDDAVANRTYVLLDRGVIGKLLPAPGSPRVLVFATLVNTFGNGAYLATSALFLTRSVGLTPAQIAIGLSAAALTGIVLTAPMGYVVDRRGPRGVQIPVLVTLAASFATLTLVRDPWSFTLLACVIAVGDATVKASTGAMIAGAVPAEERVRTRAFVRSTNNAGIGLGTLAAGAALLLDSRAGYLAVLLLNTATYLFAALIVRRVAPVAPAPVPASGPRVVALRDRPFLAFALVDGLMAALYNDLLSLALPLWLVAYTHAPVSLVSVALLVNTTGCVALQVWASRSATTALDAIPVTRRGALVVAASCVLFGLATGRSSWLVGALVLVAATVHVLGELWLSSATFAVVFDLAPDWAQGQYQAAYQTGRQVGNMTAPPLLTALVIGFGGPGWIGLAAIFAAAGLTSPHIIRSALRRVRATVAEAIP